MPALVLAGTRPGIDPMAQQAGVSHKAMIDVGGRPMLQRVLTAMAVCPFVDRIVVAIERPELVVPFLPCGKPVTVIPAAEGPSATVNMALANLGTPLLVTTADHALLRSEWIAEFIAADHGNADAVVALARRAAVLAAVPDTSRTWLRFRDDSYSGCNLFLFRTPAAFGVVSLWQEMEVARKQPLKMLRRLGLLYALRYRLGWLTLAQALQRLSHLSSARVEAVIMRDGRCAIDVDKPSDLELVRSLLGRRAQ